MITLKRFAIVVALLTGGTSLAIAQNGGSDTVILSAAQRGAVWNDLSKQATNQNAAGFDATIGTFVPNTVKVEPIPGDVAANNPSLGAYDFAMIDHKLVIVDPSNKVIADVLSPPTQQSQAEQPQAQKSQAEQPQAQKSQAEQPQAQQSQAQESQAQQPTASTATGRHGTDTVILSAAQRKAVWDDLSKQATNQNAADFDATTGVFVPNTVKIEPIPSDVAANNASLGAYDFALVDHKIVIVDPSNKVIADVLLPQAQQPEAQYPSNQQVQPNNTETANNQPSNEQTISPKTLSRNDVRQVQQALDKNGFQVGRVDGRWGPKTSNAVKQFQQSKNIQAKGQLDQQTLSDLDLNGAQFAPQNGGNAAQR
jgi:regulator of extracellular matrix RemA (YlzA/DUF370 family)